MDIDDDSRMREGNRFLQLKEQSSYFNGKGIFAYNCRRLSRLEPSSNIAHHEGHKVQLSLQVKQGKTDATY